MKKKYFLLAGMMFFVHLSLLNAAMPLSDSLKVYDPQDYIVSDFEGFNLDPDSYWNGSDLSGGFNSGGCYFPNIYDAAFYSWSGWSYSNMRDDTTAGYANQYSAITASGYDPEGSGGSTYAVSYILPDWATGAPIPVSLRFNDGQAHQVKGFYVTNATYAALSMLEGDGYAKQFGGETGDDPDWFKLNIYGFSEGQNVATMDYYLADYRFENNELDYIVDSWEWVETSALGVVDSLMFTLESTDNGEWGMNTPAFFAVDNVTIEAGPNSLNKITADNMSLSVYPNPANDYLWIAIPESFGQAELIIMDMSGRMVYDHTADAQQLCKATINTLEPGCYIVFLKSESRLLKTRFVKS